MLFHLISRKNFKLLALINKDYRNQYILIIDINVHNEKLSVLLLKFMCFVVVHMNYVIVENIAGNTYNWQHCVQKQVYFCHFSETP